MLTLRPWLASWAPKRVPGVAFKAYTDLGGMRYSTLGLVESTADLSLEDALKRIQRPRIGRPWGKAKILARASEPSQPSVFRMSVMEISRDIHKGRDLFQYMNKHLPLGPARNPSYKRFVDLSYTEKLAHRIDCKVTEYTQLVRAWRVRVLEDLACREVVTALNLTHRSGKRVLLRSTEDKLFTLFFTRHTHKPIKDAKLGMELSRFIHDTSNEYDHGLKVLAETERGEVSRDAMGLLLRANALLKRAVRIMCRVELVRMEVITCKFDNMWYTTNNVLIRSKNRMAGEAKRREKQRLAAEAAERNEERPDTEIDEESLDTELDEESLDTELDEESLDTELDEESLDTDPDEDSLDTDPDEPNLSR